MRIIILLAVVGVCSACATQHTPPSKNTYMGLSWEKSVSTQRGYDTVYTLGVCGVYTREDNTSIQFTAINEHWPEGVLTYATTIDKLESGEFEVHHSYSTTFDLNRKEGYPEYPFMFEEYDLFYSLCFKPAQVLPSHVQEFLKKYSTKSYSEFIKRKKEQNQYRTHHSVRSFYY